MEENIKRPRLTEPPQSIIPKNLLHLSETLRAALGEAPESKGETLEVSVPQLEAMANKVSSSSDSEPESRNSEPLTDPKLRLRILK